MKVINISKAPRGFKKEDGNQNGYIYIGRPGYFGNPIKVCRYRACKICNQLHETPGSTIPCFEKYARKRIEIDEQYKENVKELINYILVCYCKPNPCHGDILIKLSEELNEN